MTQGPIAVSTTPPLPGLDMVQQMNTALATLGTDFAGDDDPAAYALPFMTWADTLNGRIMRRNAAGSAWVDLGPLFEDQDPPVNGALYASQAWVNKILIAMLGEVLDDFYDVGRWALLPLNVPIPIFTHLPGGDLPPTDDPRFRYVNLTAGLTGAGGYNAGVLTGETVSGSAPTVDASATVSLAGSPLNGQVIRLINTERRFVRPGSSGTLEDSQNAAHTHSGPGAFSSNSATTSTPGQSTTGLLRNTTDGVNTGIGSSGGAEARPRGIHATFIKRIL